VTTVREGQMQDSIISMAKELREIAAALKDIVDELKRLNLKGP
jgi:hypothetical protein